MWQKCQRKKCQRKICQRKKCQMEKMPEGKNAGRKKMPEGKNAGRKKCQKEKMPEGKNARWKKCQKEKMPEEEMPEEKMSVGKIGIRYCVSIFRFFIFVGGNGCISLNTPDLLVEHYLNFSLLCSIRSIKNRHAPLTSGIYIASNVFRRIDSQIFRTLHYLEHPLFRTRLYLE